MAPHGCTTVVLERACRVRRGRLLGRRLLLLAERKLCLSSFPTSIVLITAPILFPIAIRLGIHPVHLGILMTVNMEIGLCHPPVGLNLFVIKNIAPDIPLKDLMWGVMPFVGLMMLAILLCCLFPAVVTAFPDAVMGVATR